MDADGSSALTVEQQNWYRDRFGVRYLHVQQTPQLPSRRERRAMKHGNGLRAQGRKR